jgi:shikimate kinase
MKTNIALIGFMGAGKSTIAGLLAEKLGKQAVELDKLIELKAGKSIADIFSDDGETAFRRLEIEVAGEIAAGNNRVISCGGGIVLNNINIDRLKQKGIIVYLKASSEVLHKRIINKKIDRPLLKDDNSLQAVREMMQARQPLYERAADIVIDTSDIDTETSVELIIERLKDYEGFN